LGKLRLAFSKWKAGLNNDSWKRPIAYELEHEYTGASLRFDGLKRKDAETGSLLKQVCEEYGFLLYLANFEKSVYGGCDEEDEETEDGVHPILDEFDKTTTLKKVAQLDGTKVATDLEFGEECFTSQGLFEKAPHEEEYSGYTRNKGVSTTHFYRRTVYFPYPNIGMIANYKSRWR
jgi:hypothetical protein